MSGVPSPDTAADAEVLLDALAALSMDSLEAPLAQVLRRPRGDQISDAIQDAHSALDRLVAALTAAEEERDRPITTMAALAVNVADAVRERDELREALREAGESFEWIVAAPTGTWQECYEQASRRAARAARIVRAALAASEGNQP